VNPNRTIVIATRGSALALAQARNVMESARLLFPDQPFELKVVRTTGDQMQAASMTNPDRALDKGLFTKELEVELESGAADLAVHSLKDLPTELPSGLELIATLPRADVREVLLYRDAANVAARPPITEWSPGQRLMKGFPPGLKLSRLPAKTVVATNSTRRAALLGAIRSDIEIVPIRGNVGTRLGKLAEDPKFDMTILAAAGLVRLGLFLGPKDRLMLDPTLPRGHACEPPPAGLLGRLLEPEEFLPAPGQGAIGIEIRTENPEARRIASALNHGNTWRCVLAERAFLRGIGGGCQSPVAASARIVGHQVHLRAAWMKDGSWWRGEGRRAAAEAEVLGLELAVQARGNR
jgi:hydroxymethylbilane synthase